MNFCLSFALVVVSESASKGTSVASVTVSKKFPLRVKLTVLL